MTIIEAPRFEPFDAVDELEICLVSEIVPQLLQPLAGQNVVENCIVWLVDD
jgi:hypothetical protein